MTIKTNKCSQFIAKNIKSWIEARPPRELYYETAKKLGVTIMSLNTWQKDGSISHNNLDKLSLISGIPQGLFLLDKRHRQGVQKWLDNDCNIVEQSCLKKS